MTNCIETLRHYRGQNFSINDLIWLSDNIRDKLRSQLMDTFHWIKDPYMEVMVIGYNCRVSNLATWPLEIRITCFEKVPGGEPCIIIYPRDRFGQVHADFKRPFKYWDHSMILNGDIKRND